MYCTECSTLCPETKAGYFQCATCKVVFMCQRGGANAAPSSGKAAPRGATSEVKGTGPGVEPAKPDKAARKCGTDDREQAAEDLLQTKVALSRNLTTPWLTNADLSTATDWHCQTGQDLQAQPAGPGRSRSAE